MNDEGQNRDEEHDIEDYVRTGHTRYHRISGEDNGNRTAQSHPRNEELGFQIDAFPEWKQAEEYTERTSYHNHKYADEQCHASHLEHFVRVDQQAETKEHDYLEKPCQSVHKRVNLLAVHDSVVSYHHASNVNGQIAVALHQVGDGECEEHERQQQNGIERLVVYIQLVQHKDGQFTQQITCGGTHNELYHKGEGYL